MHKKCIRVVNQYCCIDQTLREQKAFWSPNLNYREFSWNILKRFPILDMDSPWDWIDGGTCIGGWWGGYSYGWISHDKQKDQLISYVDSEIIHITGDLPFKFKALNLGTALIIVGAKCFWSTTKGDPVRCFQDTMKLYLKSGIAEAVRMGIGKAFKEVVYEDCEWGTRLLRIISEHQMGIDSEFQMG